MAIFIPFPSADPPDRSILAGRPVHVVFGEMFYEPLGLRHIFLPGTLGGTEPRPATTWMGNWSAFGFNLNPKVFGWPIEYGQGMIRLYMPRVFSPFHSLPGMVGHTGFCGSWLFYSPELEVLTAGTVDQATAASVPFRFVPKLLRALDA